MIPEIQNHSYQQRLNDLKLISLVQRRLRGQLIEVFKYLNRFNNVSPIGLFDYDFNDRTRNNGKIIIVKRFNTSIARHFFPINIATTRNALVNSRTVNTFKNHLDADWEDNAPDVLVTGNTDDVPSLTWTVVVPAGLRTNRYTIRYITTHKIATPLHHTRGWLSWALPCCLRCDPAWNGTWSWDQSLSRLGHLTTTATTVTVRMNIWGVTRPGTGE